MEPHYIYVVGWPTLCLIIAGIAQGKGRSGLGWFVASMFLGPLALLILLFCRNLNQIGWRNNS